MGFARAWRLRAAARFWRRGAHGGANVSVRERDPRSVVVVERLKRRSEFRAAAGGLRTSAACFALQARARANDGPVRVGFTVSRQVGNAVERNRVRRRLREVVRLLAARATGGAVLQRGHDYVLVARRAAIAAPFPEMLREFDAALGRIQALEKAADARRGTGGAQKGRLHEAGSPPRRPTTGRGRTAPDHSRKSTE
jgi:ribonuclease P protein component